MSKSPSSVLFLLFLALSVSALAGEPWHAPLCQESCAVQESTTSLTVPPELLSLSSLIRESDNFSHSIDAEILKWGDFTRWLKGDPTKRKPNLSEFQNRLDQIQNEAESLLEIHRAVGITQRRLDVCRKMCGAQRRVELERELENLLRLRTHLASMSPWWLSEEFGKIADKARNDSDYVPNQGELKKALISSFAHFFKESMDLQSELSVIKSKAESSLSKGVESPKLLFTNLSLNHGKALDLLLKKGISEGDKNLCLIADTKSTVDKTLSYAGTGLEVGLMTVSILAGPQGFLTTAALRSGVGILGRIGLASRSISPLIPNAVLTGKMINEATSLTRECEQTLTLVKLDLKDASEWQKCIKEREEAQFMAILSTTAHALGPLLPKTYGYFTKSHFKTGPPSVRIGKMKDGKTLSVLDLADQRAIKSKDLGNVSERYWEFVGGVYQKRLNLTPEEIKAFVETSKQFESRTKLIMVTNGSPQAGKIEGGVGLVTSKRSKDLLPLEKATGYKVGRENGKVAEIVRLSSVSEDNPMLMKDLLKELSQLTRGDPDLKKIYVYTSKIHARLYKRLGIPGKEVGPAIDRDVILEVDAVEFAKRMSHAD